MSVIAIANHKGGVGKTTTAINLGDQIAQAGKRVLIIDLDPQAHCTIGFGIVDGARRKTTYHFLANSKEPLSDCRVELRDNLHLIPSDLQLALMEVELVNALNRDYKLKKRLEEALGLYDYILIDCPPSLGFLTINAIVASQTVLIPVSMGFFSLYGVIQLTDTIRSLIEEFGLMLHLYAFPTMTDRTNFSREVQEKLREQFGENLLPVAIPKTIRLTESTAKGVPLSQYSPDSPALHEYAKLAKEIIAREER